MSDVLAIERLKEYLGNVNCSIEELTPDASTRAYFRTHSHGETAIACVYPQDEHGNAQFKACLDVTNVFLSANLPVAKIISSNSEQGIIVHEDFGDEILRDVLQKSDPEERERLLNEAISLIARIQAATPIAFSQNSIASKLKFDEEKLLWELNFFKTHYFESLMKSQLSSSENEALEKEFTEIARELELHAKVLCHRDFHAANLMVQNGELKIIDHQDARLGSTSYDIVSLLLDRVTELPDLMWLADKCVFLEEAREKLGLEIFEDEEFIEEFSLQTIQRCLKAVGTFSFQAAFRDKTHFIQYINPMFQIVLRACENLQRFPTLQRCIKQIIK